MSSFVKPITNDEVLKQLPKVVQAVKLKALEVDNVIGVEWGPL
jgi:hypothetical protein